MQTITGTAPEAAERVRSALRRCPRATLVPVGAAGPGSDGVLTRVVLTHVDVDARTLVLGLASGTSPSAVVAGTARLDLVDEVVGSVAGGYVRAWVGSEGVVGPLDPDSQRVTARRIAADLPDPALLDVGDTLQLVVFRPSVVTLGDAAGVTAVDLDDLLTSGPDPFVDIEGLWISQLNDPRCPVLPRIRRRLSGPCAGDPAVVVGVDRFGLTLAASDVDGGARELRLAFAEACTTAVDLARQLRLLAGCPRSTRTLRAEPC